MKFRTETEVPEIRERISPGNKIFSIGSCFAENMAAKLADGGFAVMSNPFGVLYNPASIASALTDIFAGRQYTESDLVRNGELWCSPLFHGNFSGSDRDKVLGDMNRAATQAREALREASFVLISFGTPWVYTVSENFTTLHPAIPQGMVVANCHKFPADHYDRRRMTIDEITDTFSHLLVGPLKGKKVIFTVSPVRYIKDGLHGSNLGKAVLLLATELICAANPDAYYFPAYEAVADDLRDYRFYARDMVHPSPEAVDYIWELFRVHAMTPEAARQAVEIEKLTAATRHRVQNPGTAAHIQYLAGMLSKTAVLREEFPHAQLDTQESFFRGQVEKI